MQVKSNTYQDSSVSFLTDIAALFKLRLALTVVFSSLMAYAIVAGANFNLGVFIAVAIGGAMVTFSANTLNEVLERDFDKLMVRTENRPLAAGRMTLSNAVLIAGILALLGTTILTWAHPLAGFIGMISIVLYAFIYTPMKRYSPAAVYVGAIPGALPLLIGGIAGGGDIGMYAIILFGIQFFWQLPHFWAIAWLGHEDYTKAGFRLLPNAKNELNESVGMQSAIQAILIIPIIALGYYYNLFDSWALIAGSILTIWYSWKGYQLYRIQNREVARKLMFASFAYLPCILFILLIDVFI